MICNDFETLIPLYLDRNMGLGKMEAFLEHLETCKECKGEFDIRYIIQYGFENEEYLEDLDFIKKIDDEIKYNKARVIIAKKRKFFQRCLIIGVDIIVGLCAFHMIMHG